ncbi:MAG: hypothetical protein K2X09_03575 [Rickettsiales bacterium]|nr:hypothetical protein [Rickettsiales bacterium]
MSSTTDFLATHKPRDVLAGIHQLATGKSADEGDIRPDTVTITVGSIPENSEYRKFVERTRAEITAYDKDPTAYIADSTKKNYLTESEVKALPKQMETTRQELKAMEETLKRSDLVTIEYTGMYAKYQELSAYIEKTAGSGSVVDAGRFTKGVPQYRCGFQNYPEGLVVTQAAFDKVLQPMIAGKEIAAQNTTQGKAVPDTTPNDGKSTLAFGAELGMARQQSGGCAR